LTIPVSGCRYANNENYEKALLDFIEALKHNPNHQNANEYLKQTLLAHSKK